MVNVLPQKNQKKLRRIYRERLLLAGALAALTLGTLSFVVLIPSFVTLRYDAASLGTAGVGASATTSNAIKAVGEMKNLLTVIGKTGVATSTSIEPLRLAVSLRPSGVMLQAVGYIKNTTSGQIVLSGIASQPSAIESYRLALVGSGRFSQVNVPVGSLAGTTNGQFSITLSGNF